MADPNNITLRSDVARPLTWEEADANFAELQLLLEEYDVFIATEYSALVDEVEQNKQDSILYAIALG